MPKSTGYPTASSLSRKYPDGTRINIQHVTFGGLSSLGGWTVKGPTLVNTDGVSWGDFKKRYKQDNGISVGRIGRAEIVSRPLVTRAEAKAETSKRRRFATRPMGRSR